ncbi:T-cell surface antigen CD2-like [Symphorus nematophorus]
MACFAATLGVIFLSGFINLSAAKDSCDLYATVGQSLTLPFVYNGLDNSHVLRWTHNNKIIFYGQKSRVSVGKPTDISATGSLLLKNLQASSAGTYQANLLHPNGTLAKSWIGQLCMMDKVSKPQLTYSCDFKSSAVNLNCHVANPQGLMFSWAIDENTLKSETKQKLSISLAQLKGLRNFTCSVANKVSKENSDTVRPICTSPTPPAPTLLCFPHKKVVAVLAGGASVTMLLLMIIMILCCCLRRNKMRPKDKGELSMLSLSKRDLDSSGPEYETMHPTEDSPAPNPEPSTKPSYESVSQPETQTENRLLQPATDAKGQQPSPVPKPRTKAPQTSNI